MHRGLLHLLNYCAGVLRASKMFPWGSAPAKRLKTTELEVQQIKLEIGASPLKIINGGTSVYRY